MQAVGFEALLSLLTSDVFELFFCEKKEGGGGGAGYVVYKRSLSSILDTVFCLRFQSSIKDFFFPLFLFLSLVHVAGLPTANRL